VEASPASHTTAHESTITVAPFRAWRDSQRIIARGPARDTIKHEYTCLCNHSHALWVNMQSLSSVAKPCKSKGCKTNSSGGERGIRTLDTLPYTHFPGVLLQPLGHLTVMRLKNTCLQELFKGATLYNRGLFNTSSQITGAHIDCQESRFLWG
jgi:hypothetical protein